MNLSGTGVIADLLWHEIKNHAKNIELGEFIVMSNYIHGILILDDNNIPYEEPRHALALQFGACLVSSGLGMPCLFDIGSYNVCSLMEIPWQSNSKLNKLQYLRN
tara:strand:+ start:5562 stop:5876 length:315 start_codon:yes stop_codon:yes gene_type:complete